MSDDNQYPHVKIFVKIFFKGATETLNKITDFYVKEFLHKDDPCPLFTFEGRVLTLYICPQLLPAFCVALVQSDIADSENKYDLIPIFGGWA